MYSLRKWIFRPKRTDSSYLAQFFHSDEELNMVASELDSFDGRKDPERCNALVNQLRMCQDKVLTIVEKIMEEVITEHRANRDFRVKFPDDVLQESLAGQLWFGAECLAAGSSIMNREVESASMRPLAKALTRHLDYLRSLLRDQCLRNHNSYTDKIKEGLVVFDKLFAEFELSYVSAMVPVKTMKEYDVLQEVIVLFSETTQRAMKLSLLTQDMIDDYDPALMFTIPRLAIICGLLIYPEGPLNPDMDPMNMSEMFRPFQTLLYKIRELLWTLSREELWLLEKALCSAEEPGLYRAVDPVNFQDECDLANIPDWYYPPNLSSKTEASIGETLRTRLHRDNPFTGQLGADILEAAYGSMSQSPSIQTIVSNPNYRSEVDTLSSSTLEELEGAAGSQTSTSLEANPLIKQHSADSGTIKASTSDSSQGDVEDEGATAAARDSRSLRHSLSWPESRRRAGRSGRMSEGEAQVLDYDVDSLQDDSLVDPALHLTASTQEFNFHLPLNTELVRPESSEHEYAIPTISAQRMTPSAPAPGNLQRIFITSEQEREEVEDLSQISFVTDALTDVFITDFNFADSSKDGGKGSKIKSTRRKTEDESDTKDSPEGLASESNEIGSTTSLPGQNKNEGEIAKIQEGDSEKVDPSCDSSVMRLNLEPASDAEPGSSLMNDVDEDIAQESDGLEYASLSTESETDDYKASQRAVAQAQECAIVASNVNFENENRSDDDKGAMKISNASSIDEVDQLTNKVYVEGKIETEEGTSTPHWQCSKLHSEFDCDCDISEGDNSCVDSSSGGKSELDAGSVTPTVDVEPGASHSQQKTARAQRLKYSDFSSVVQGTIPGGNATGVSDFDWDRESYSSSETSSYTSECQDDEEIALAIQAAELAARREARARFKSSAELIHRLFVCVSGVADQLQTNYASDLRHILKAVFECNASEPYIPIDVATATDNEQPTLSNEASTSAVGDADTSSTALADAQPPSEEVTPHDGSADEIPTEGAEEADENMTSSPHGESNSTDASSQQQAEEAEPPKWVPDEQSPHCTGCKVPFTFVRRRHHCRNCGKVFCGRCSANQVPLPHYGHNKAVRVCNHCFMFQVTPFTMQ